MPCKAFVALQDWCGWRRSLWGNDIICSTLPLCSEQLQHSSPLPSKRMFPPCRDNFQKTSGHAHPDVYHANTLSKNDRNMRRHRRVILDVKSKHRVAKIKLARVQPI